MSADGLRLALSWLSVLPLRVRTADARTCRHAITAAPLVGALLGALAAGVLRALTAVGSPAPLAGFLAVGALVLVTRGMHVDGLADAVDGLGCYGPPERALQVMKDGGAGPFGVAALVVALGAQALSLGELAARGQWWAVVLACATGRAAFALCCRRGQPAAQAEGMGALVAGSQSPWTVGGWWLVLAGLGGFAVDPWWAGVLAVALAGLAVFGLSLHVRERFGGVNGDVLGAASEVATTIVLVVCTFR